MTFHEFIEQSLAGFEQHLRREELDERTFEMRLRGARQFARLLLGEPHSTGEPTIRKGDPTTRRFGGPK
jgi:hypothetical protein